MWETAGVLGLDPRPYAFHQLKMMRDGRETESWDRLSYLLAAYFGSKGVKNVTMEQFHKFHMKAKPAFTTDNLKSLKGQF